MDSSQSLRIVGSPGSEPLPGNTGRGFLCADLMTTDLVVLGPDDTVADAAVKMRDQNLGFLPVCLRGRLLGVLTDRDLAMRVLAQHRSFLTPVGEVMSRDPVTCPASAELEVADGLMRSHRKLRIPCVDDDGRLVGVISLADVARYCDPERAGDLLGEVVEREVPGATRRGAI
jgi:CBS domain-containing protein